MTDRPCLSVLEVQGLQDQGLDDSQTKHLEDCPRCRGLVHSLAPAPPYEAADRSECLSVSPRESGAIPAQLRTGDLVRAVLDQDSAVVVIVIGSRSEAPDTYLVAPVSGDVVNAAEGDVLLDQESLGYSAVASVWNCGDVEAGQLQTHVGRVGRGERQKLLAAFQSLTSDQPFLEEMIAPILSRTDPRAQWRDDQNLRLRPLFQLVRQQLDEPSTPPLTAGTVLTGLFEAEWDRNEVLEQTQVEADRLQAFLEDKLDLRGRSDVVDLAQILGTMEQTYEDFADPIRASLSLVPLSALSDPHEQQRLAASSFADDLTPAERTKALMQGRQPRQATARDRARAIDAYLVDVRNALDEL